MLFYPGANNIAKGGACDYGNHFECGKGADCELPAKGGIRGTCECHTMWGIYGPRCDKVNSSGWMFLAGSALSLLFALYVIGVHVSVGREMRKRGKFKFDDLGRTLIFSILLSTCVVCLDLGFIITVSYACLLKVSLDFIAPSITSHGK